MRNTNGVRRFCARNSNITHISTALFLSSTALYYYPLCICYCAFCWWNCHWVEQVTIHSVLIRYFISAIMQSIGMAIFTRLTLSLESTPQFSPSTSSQPLCLCPACSCSYHISLCQLTTLTIRNSLSLSRITYLFHKSFPPLHFAWVVEDAKCIVVTRVCLSVCPRPYAHTNARTRM